MHPKVYQAAKLGDFNSLITTISRNGEDLFHQTTPKENNILHVAAQYKQVNFIEHFLRCPSGPSLLWQGNYKGDTPLHVAAKVGSCGVVRVFIDFMKSLHWAVENGQVDACKELLRKQNLNKDTALHYALRGGHDLVAELLIIENPQLCDITNEAEESPLYLAADRGLSHTTELILGAFSPSSSHKGPKGLTALHVGVTLSLTSWEKIMEKRPEAIKEGDDMGWTPLHYVAYLGKVKVVRLLLQHDTSVAYDLDKAGESALHLAAFQGHANVIDELVTSCPDAFDIINTKGQTALHAAIIGGHVNVVRYFLRLPNQGDLINEQDNNRNTALHLAALHNQDIIIDILARDKRVDRLAKNKDHLTALDIFYTLERDKVCHPLEGSHGIPGFQGWFIEYGKKRLEKQFVERQPSVSITTGSNSANRDNFNLSKKGIMDVQLLVAGLIATISFSGLLTVPGGYNDDGIAIHSGRGCFEGFMLCNDIAFVLSMMAILLHCISFTHSYRQEPKCIPIVGCFVYLAIGGILLAYVFGRATISARPTESTGERMMYYSLWVCFLAWFFIYEFPDHEAHSWALRRSPKRSIGRFLSKCMMQWANFQRRLIDWSLDKLMSWAGFTVP